MSLKLTRHVIPSYLALQLRRKNIYTVWTRQYFNNRLLKAGRFFNGFIKSISTCIIPCKRQQTYDCDQETAQKFFFCNSHVIAPVKFFIIKPNFLLYIFVFHVLDGSISFPVWIKRTVVVNYYKANDISWQVILPSCACWFFPWLYCFYKCTNSYWNDETLVCTALTRILRGPLCWQPAHK